MIDQMTKNKLIIAATLSIATAAATEEASEVLCRNMNMRFGDRLVTLSRIEEELHEDTVGCFLTPDGQDCLVVEELL